MSELDWNTLPAPERVAILGPMLDEGMQMAEIAERLSLIYGPVNAGSLRTFCFRNELAPDEAAAHARAQARAADLAARRRANVVEPLRAPMVAKLRPAPRWTAPIDEGPVTILTVKGGQCRFPKAGEGADMILCGEPALEGESWCKSCRAIAYVAPEDRPRRKAGARFVLPGPTMTGYGRGV